MTGDTTEEATQLLQQLIRNKCVNEGTPDSGHESRSVETLASYLAGPGVEMQRFEAVADRGSLVLRIEGADTTAPALCLMGHLDVVPANPAGWRHDPFGGELIDGEVWGRGAIDMLGITASMAVATKRLLFEGWRPRGTLIFVAVADEEAQGAYGAEWMVNEHWDAVTCDNLITEYGGARVPFGTSPKLALMVGEKGSHWTRLRVKGVPGHGSMPYKTDNAVVKMAEVIRRIAAYRPPAVMHDVWLAFVDGLGLSVPQRFAMRTGPGLELVLDRMPVGPARMMHGITHTTFSPNIAQGGVKTNIVPDHAEVTIDIRTLPGVDASAVRSMLKDAVGDLWTAVEIADESDNPATQSPLESDLSRALTQVSARLVPGATTVPLLLFAATDARFFRRKGVTAYGYGLFSEHFSLNEVATMFHGNDERIDQASLRLMVDLWEGTARELLA